MSGNNPRSQYSIAEEALGLIFEGDIKIVEQPGISGFLVQAVGTPRLIGIEKAIQLLRSETGQGKAIDPFKASDGTAWVIVGSVLSQWRLYSIALNVMARYLDVCYELQNELNRRMHKGAPLFWVADEHMALGQTELASAYMLLAFVEDSHYYDDASIAPAFQYLAGFYGFSPKELKELMDFSNKRQGEFPFYPEEVFIEWKLAQLRNKGEV